MQSGSKTKLPPLELKKADCKFNIFKADPAIIEKRDISGRRLDSTLKNDTRSSARPLEKYEVDVVIKIATPKHKEISHEVSSPKRDVKTTLAMASVPNTSSLSAMLRKKISHGKFYSR